MAFGEMAGETPEDRLIRLCHVACTWAEVKFCGVRTACATSSRGTAPTPMTRIARPHFFPSPSPSKASRGRQQLNR